MTTLITVILILGVLSLPIVATLLTLVLIVIQLSNDNEEN